MSRAFLLSNRVTLDWRLDATNLLNRVTYTSINTIVGSPQFGLPIQANTMRRVAGECEAEILTKGFTTEDTKDTERHFRKTADNDEKS